MSETVIGESADDTRPRIAVAIGSALLVAGVLLVTAILPAEFAVDPIGVGAKLGLMDLGVVGKQVDALNASAAAGGSAANSASVIVPQDKAFHQETVTFTIAPGDGMEYKYRLDKGQALLFSWRADVTVNYEAHAEPDGAPRGYAQSYEKSTGSSKSGTLTAPFSGIHGWYWQNPTDRPVTVTLSSAGFYTLSHEFASDGSVKNKTFP
jgi:hypothetical protein